MRWEGHVARMGEVYTGFWWGNVGESCHSEVPGVDGRIILKWIFQEVGCGGIELIDLAQNRDRWWDLVNAVMNLRVP